MYPYAFLDTELFVNIRSAYCLTHCTRTAAHVHLTTETIRSSRLQGVPKVGQRRNLVKNSFYLIKC